MDWDSLNAGLRKKASFEACVREATDWCKQQQQPSSIDAAKLLQLVKAVHRLLKTRYSSVAFLCAGESLMVAAQAALHGDTGAVAQLEECLLEARAFLSDAGGAVPPPLGSGAAGANGSGPEPQQQQQQQQPYLFEGQLSSEPEHSHGAARMYRAAQALAEARERDGDRRAAAGESEEEALNRHFGELLQALLGSAGGAGGEGGGLWETDLLGEGFQFEDVAPASRPASKKVVRQLRRLVLSDVMLAEQGAAASCPVCMDNFKAGDEVQVLPCAGKHVFHPSCLAPWLAANHSCPMCRHELPTDDDEYERRKARDAREAEERRGAENALRGGEHMYL